MRIGSNTGVYRSASDVPHLMTEKEIVRKLREIGFETLDLNMAEINDPEFFLCQDDWQERADEIANEAARAGIVFSQIHVPFTSRGVRELDPNFKKPGYAEHYAECTRRAYIVGGMVGAPWAVAHCDNYPGFCFDRDLTMAGNHAFYDPYVELGIRNGIGTAFENMIQKKGAPVPFRFSSHYDDLIEFVDSFHDPMVKICWDFGHANLTRLDQSAALRKVGSRLACLHVDDNFGDTDNHTIPFVGKVDWFEVIPVLAEIGYGGDCSLEVGPSTQKAPAAMQDALAQAAFTACKYLCRLFDEAKAALIS